MSNIFNQPGQQAFPHSAGTAHLAGQAMARFRLAAAERHNAQAHSRFDGPNTNRATARAQPNVFTPAHLQRPLAPQFRGKSKISRGNFKNTLANRERRVTAGFSSTRRRK
jgi:hypothetical protein